MPAGLKESLRCGIPRTGKKLPASIRLREIMSRLQFPTALPLISPLMGETQVPRSGCCAWLLLKRGTVAGEYLCFCGLEIFLVVSAAIVNAFLSRWNCRGFSLRTTNVTDLLPNRWAKHI